MQSNCNKSVTLFNPLRRLTTRIMLVMLGFIALQTVNAQVVNVTQTLDVVNGNTANIASLNASNGGDGVSLREAVLAANGEPVGANITINVAAGTYTLTLVGVENNGATGDLDLNSTVAAGMKTVTVNGVDSNSTIFQVGAGVNERFFEIHSINNPGSITFNLNRVRIQNVVITSGSGAAILAGRPGDNTTIDLSAFNGNSAINGGAISKSSAGATHHLTITNSSFTNNTASGAGGAVNYSGQGTVSITNSRFASNTNTGGTGGAINLSGGAPGGSYTVSRNTFINNRVLAGGHGGAVAHGVGDVVLAYNRFINNTAATPANGNTLYQAGGDPGHTIIANDNWWGVNTGPPANSTAVGTAPVTAPVITTWLQLKSTASPTDICTTPPGNTSTVTSGFTSNSAGAAIAPANLTALVGLPITFTATGGTLSAAQPTIQASGTATVLFTAGAVATTGTVNPVVDNIPNNDATARASINITAGPVVTDQPDDVSLCGTTTAVFSVVATGSGTLTYQWFKGATQLNNGAFGTAAISGATTNTLTITNASSADNASNYYVVVTNTCGSVPSSNASLAVSAAPVVNAPGVTQPSCSSSTGTIVVNATSTETLEYSVNNGGSYQASNTFAGLAPGSYNIRVRVLANPGCFTSYSGNPVSIVASPGAPVISAPTVTQPTCATPTGTIVVNATGGSTLEYSIDGGSGWQLSNTFSSLAPGNYNIRVRLQATPSCFADYTGNPVAINPVPAVPTVNAPTVTQPTCAVPTGTIVVNASGSGTLEYSSNGGGSWQASNSFSGLAPGLYNIRVRLQANPTCFTDYSGNAVTINAVPVAPNVSAPTVTQPTCAVPTGTIVVNATGSGTLEYSVDNGGAWQASNSFTGLAAGNYNIRVRLQSSPTCFTNYSGNPVVLNAVPALPVVNAPTITQPTCAVPSGTIVVNATGAGTLEYSIDNGGSFQASSTFGGLAPGTYNIRVRLQSSPSCFTNYSGNPVTIDAIPVAPSVSAPTVTQPTCGVPSGTIVVNATGTGTLEYSVNGGGSWQASNTFNSLTPGAYQVRVRLQSSTTCFTDYAGNPVTINAVPTSPSISAPTVTQPTCATPTGTIVMNATGGGALEYSLNGGTWQSSETFSGLAPGNYNIAVRLIADPTCSGTYAGNPVVIDPSPLPTVNDPADQVICTGSATTAVAFSGSTVSGTVYNWTNNNTSIGLAASGTGDISSFVATNTGTTPVTATITVTPVAFACTGTVQTFTITVNPNLTINTQPVNATICDGGNTSFTVAAVGTAPITYQWQIDQGSGFVNLNNAPPFNGVTTNTLSVAGANMTYNGNPVRVVINSGCGGPTTSASATLTVLPLPTIAVAPANQCSPVTLTATGNSNTYSWSPAAGLNTTTGAVVVANPIVNTVYTVTGTITATGCTNSATVTVNATPAAAVVTPSSTSICAGAITQLTVAPIPCVYNAAGTITIPGGPVNTNGPASVYPSTISVSGLPTSGIRVKSVTINGLSHTFPLDVDILLRSPSGTNVVLMSDVGGNTPITGINYTFDDAAATSLTPLAAPSGTYKPSNIGAADTWVAPGPGLVNQNNPALSMFTGDANGQWQLFIVDDVSGEAGSITGWSMTLEWAGAVWSPATGLFTNSVATIPYTAGTYVSTVYAKPATTTTYSVTRTNGTCTSTATNVTVTVQQPIAITTQPVSQTVCQGANVTFTVASSGNLQSYQWQVNTGSGFTNITGANSPSLILNGVTPAMSGNQYRAVVSNSCFNATSNNATLTVNAAPAITVGALPTKICVSDGPIALVGTPAGGTWSGIGVSGNNFIPANTAVGTYTLTYTLTNPAGCTSTATLLAKVESCPERMILLRDDAVILGPNPNNGLFNIRINSTMYNYLGMNVYTAAGSLVRTQTFGGLVYGRVIPINLTNLPGGVYMVKFFYDNGVHTAEKTFKVVIGR